MSGLTQVGTLTIPICRLTKHAYILGGAHTMIDIQSLLPQLSILKQKKAESDAQPLRSFDSVLNDAISSVTPAEDTTPPTIDSIDSMSSLPSEIKTLIKNLTQGLPLSDEQLKGASKQLAILSRGLVDMTNNYATSTDSAQSEIDLQFVSFGVFQLIENYAYKPAVSDLVQTWKSIDMRTDTYQSLITGIVDFIKKKKCPLKGLGLDDTKDNSEIKKVTWEIQFELWEQVSAMGNTLRSQPILKAFNDSNQMDSAKVDFKGSRVDELIDPVLPGIG